MPERLFYLERPAGIDVLVRGEAMFWRVVTEVRPDVVQQPDRGLFRAGAQSGNGEYDIVGES